MTRRTILIITLIALIIAAVPTMAPAMRGLLSSTRSQTAAQQHDHEVGNPLGGEAGSPGQAEANMQQMYDEMSPGSGIGTMSAQNSPIADPNAVKARVAAYPDLPPALDLVSRKSTLEVNQWLNPKTDDNRIMQIRASYRQVASELLLLRAVAVKDGAKKTVAALDSILLDRETRYQKLIRTIQKAELEAKRNGTQERGTNTRGRTTLRNSRYGNTRGGYNTRRRR